MGTRSITVVTDLASHTEICVMYRQYDGYLSGHGKELALFLDGYKIVNGLSVNPIGKVANGVDCLAAQMIAHFKEKPGNIYLRPAGTRANDVDYQYFVYGQTPDFFANDYTGIEVEVKAYCWADSDMNGGYKSIFIGNVQEFKDYINSTNEDNS
jgi:hypothetical protein